MYICLPEWHLSRDLQNNDCMSQPYSESQLPQAYHAALMKPHLEPTKWSDADIEGIYKAEMLVHNAKQA